MLFNTLILAIILYSISWYQFLDLAARKPLKPAYDRPSFITCNAITILHGYASRPYLGVLRVALSLNLKR